MTTLAVIGGGIAGRSLIYTLANQKNDFSTILWFESDSFAFSCTLHSTAVVAPRGVSTGLSVLGDQISSGFNTFSDHVKTFHPQGVKLITQWTLASEKIQSFKNRYPESREVTEIFGVKLNTPHELAQEDAYLIEPATYLEWLWANSHDEKINRIEDFVIEVIGSEIKTQKGKNFQADKIIFATGVNNYLWKDLFADSKLKHTKVVQGSYLEFDFDLNQKDFSVTLDGDNLIYHADNQKLLIGSTTSEVLHELAPLHELKEIYSRIGQKLNFKLPEFESGKVLVGRREKASKREAYILQSGSYYALGGFYKNGFSLALDQAQKLINQL